MALGNLAPGRLLAGMALACIAAVGAALVAQHSFDMQPCPWCILQRVIFLAIALVCALGALVASRAVRAGAAGLAIVLSLLGVAAALWQHFVAAKSASCNLTLADRIIGKLGLESLLPAMFQVTASCADAVASIAGVPFEFWSLVLYVLLALAAVVSLRSARR
jgi:disulfide bond formation protein DsbB